MIHFPPVEVSAWKMEESGVVHSGLEDFIAVHQEMPVQNLRSVHSDIVLNGILVNRMIPILIVVIEIFNPI